MSVRLAPTAKKEYAFYQATSKYTWWRRDDGVSTNAFVNILGSGLQLSLPGSLFFQLENQFNLLGDFEEYLWNVDAFVSRHLHELYSEAGGALLPCLSADLPLLG